MAVHAYITSRLDYCSSLYCGSSKSLIDRLQLVQNAAARFLHNSRKSTHITPILRILHWLPIKFRIDFKILLFVYKSLHDLAPIYLSELLHQWVSATFFDGSIGFSSRVVEFACLYLIHIFLFIFVFFVLLFLFFSHITQHNIQNITKQNNRHILNISRSNQKGGREGRTIKTQKSLLYTITYIHQKTLPSINGRGPGPTNSRRCTFT